MDYSKESKGYWLLDEGTKNIIVWRDIIFNETDFGHIKQTKDTYLFEVSESSSEEPENDTPQDEEERSQQPRRPER